jgi:hypothetical protein
MDFIVELDDLGKGEDDPNSKVDGNVGEGLAWGVIGLGSV